MNKILNRLRFMFLLRNDKTDRTVEEIIKKIMELDIKKCIYTDFHIKLVTDNYTYMLWNGNKYYAWLSEGTIYDDSKTIFDWQNKMPSKRTMADFKTFLESFVDKEVIRKIS